MPYYKRPRRSSYRRRTGRRRYSGGTRTNQWVRSTVSLTVPATGAAVSPMMDETDIDQGTTALSTVVRVHGAVRCTTESSTTSQTVGITMGIGIFDPDDAPEVDLGKTGLDWFYYEWTPVIMYPYIRVPSDPATAGVITSAWRFDAKSARKIGDVSPLARPYIAASQTNGAGGTQLLTVHWSMLLKH